MARVSSSEKPSESREFGFPKPEPNGDSTD